MKTIPAQPVSAVLMTLDGLGARYLGAYGNDHVPTPNVDRFASDGILFEQAMAPMFRPQEWCSPSGVANQSFAITDWLRKRVGNNFLVTDDEALAEAARGLWKVVEVPWQQTQRLAASEWDTQLAKWFATGYEVIQNLPPGFLVWMHSKSLRCVWDAPFAWRERMTGDDELPPTDDPRPSVRERVAADDPQIWQIRAAYAAQICVLDLLWGAWSEHVRGWQADHGPLMTVLTSWGGYPLGEHGVIGGETSPYHERLHIPLILQPCLPKQYGTRFEHLVEPTDTWQWLAGWFEGRRDTVLATKGWRANHQQEVWIGGDASTKLLRTHRWYFVETGERTHLFLKPDDRWDQNDISSRCPDVVIQLREQWLKLHTPAITRLP